MTQPRLSAKLVSSNKMGKTLISYVHFDREEDGIAENVQFFIKHGVIEDDQTSFAFVINGGELSVELPTTYNSRVIYRPNTGYDFAAYNASLSSINLEEYDYFIFMNDTVRGPFLPRYIPSSFTWVDLFIDKIGERVKLVGPTICYQSPLPFVPQAHIQSMCFGTDREGVKILLEAGVFEAGEESGSLTGSDKDRYIMDHEVKASQCIMDAGYELQPFQLSYPTQVGHGDIHTNHRYGGATPNPCEIMFIKTNRITNRVVDNYTRWLLPPPASFKEGSPCCRRSLIDLPHPINPSLMPSFIKKG